MSTQKNNKISKRALPGYTLIPKEDHYQIKKISLSGKLVNTDPRFINTRRNNQEFGHLMKSSSLMRSVLLVETGKKLPARPFINALRNLQVADQHNRYGSRSPVNGPIDQLEGFNFNDACPWQTCVNTGVLVTVDTRNNIVEITFPACTANEAVNPPPGATHYNLYAIVASFDLDHLQADREIIKKGHLPIKAIKTKTIIREIKTGRHQLNMVVTGVKWYRTNEKTNNIVPLKIPGPLIISKIWKSGDHNTANERFAA
ncbi:hypothetical protein HB364_14840 [Pseudoflavitalea sp. X16]|uniref:hypothetical protein n=1 Tax=Paraflavitalea devenefica TaxID=2716334 RepID=UPI00141DC2B4|nr:hypothetical protein [Paraflavitalea devenefica]NII26365.1 hypothetical protein [Paraflavitalea devenefica]